MGTFTFIPKACKERNDLTNENPTPLYTKTDEEDDDDGDTLVSFRIDDFNCKLLLLICLVLLICCCSDLLLFGSKTDATSGFKGKTKVF